MTRATRRHVCAEPSCNEAAFYEFSTQRDAREHSLRLAKAPWRCTRHTQPDEVLSATNRVRRFAMSAERSRRFPNLGDRLFWRNEGADHESSAFAFGPGFKAFAGDFPEGTQVVITAEVHLPTDKESA